MDELLQEHAENKDETSLYEVGFHLLPSLSGEALSGEVAKIKDAITARQGVVISEGVPQRMSLAYKLPRVVENVRTFFDSSHFGWIRFEMPLKESSFFEREMKNNASVIRFILLRAQPESARVVTQKMTFLAPKSRINGEEEERVIEKKSRRESAETSKVFSETEMDKTIEELIAG